MSIRSFFQPARQRKAATLVELVLFLAFFVVVSGIMVVMLVATQENRLRQQTIAKVEQDGIQVLQTISLRVRGAERILWPAMGATGSIVALQMAQEEEDPTIITVQTGAAVVVRQDTLQTLTSGEITIENFVVRNTSASSNRNSLLLSFDAVRSLPPPISLTYRRTFEALVTLFPDDQLQGNACSCASPTCNAGVFHWNVCSDDACEQATNEFSC